MNKIYDSLHDVWPGCEAWLKSCNVKKEDYHGGSFEGNESRKLLKNVQKLREIIPTEYEEFANTFEVFNRVVTACYGTNLASDYKEHIADFRNSYLKLKISVTPKVHAVFWHIIDFCEVFGMGLGPWSEQCSESIHHDFKATKDRFKDEDHQDYGKHLYEAVCMYNGKHAN